MTIRHVLLLAVLVLLLGAFIVFYEQDLPTTAARQVETRRVLALQPEQIDRLTLQWQGDDEATVHELVFARQAQPDDPDRPWRIREPIEAVADRWMIDSLLGTLTDLEAKRTVEDVSRTAVGLDVPRATITLGAAGGDDDDTVIDVGPMVPASNDMIVGVRGRDGIVYRVESALYADITRPAASWRDRTILSIERDAVAQIVLRRGVFRIAVERRDDGLWLREPFADRIDSGLAGRLLSAVTEVTAERFHDHLSDPDQRHLLDTVGLDPPNAIATLTLSGRDTPFILELGNAQPVLPAAADAEGDAGAARALEDPNDPTTLLSDDIGYARADRVIFETRTPLRSLLDVPLERWRDRAWTPFQVFNIESATLRDETGLVSLVREGGNWLRGGDRMAYDAVSDLLYAITEIEGEQVLPQATLSDEHQLDLPRLEIRLMSGDGQTERLALFSTLGTEVVATTDSRPDVALLVPVSAVERLTAHLSTLRTAKPLPPTAPAAANRDS
ncbi:MAG: DUF4340 domain-containing protein [Acidobacteriota bacterium]